MPEGFGSSLYCCSWAWRRVRSPPPRPRSPPPEVRENLEYQISLGPWSDVARVHLVLKELKPGHYLAEFSGAAQGMWKLLSRWLPERYQTEMVYRDGRLQPVVYREEFQEKGQKVLKEYRFDYDHSRLTLWRQVDGGENIKEWEVPLTGPVYDLLSLFYNVRLDALGPAPGGASLRVMVLPDPKPKELVFCIGDVTDEGLKVMVNSCLAGRGRRGSVFYVSQPGTGPHPGLDPGNPLWQARRAPGEPRRDQEGGAVGPARLRFSRP